MARRHANLGREHLRRVEATTMDEPCMEAHRTDAVGSVGVAHSVTLLALDERPDDQGADLIEAECGSRSL